MILEPVLKLVAEIKLKHNPRFTPLRKRLSFRRRICVASPPLRDTFCRYAGASFSRSSVGLRAGFSFLRLLAGRALRVVVDAHVRLLRPAAGDAGVGLDRLYRPARATRREKPLHVDRSWCDGRNRSSVRL